ncbi:MAG TPA: hypothetical protein VFL80_09535 [Thermoanaerobaculia bacterium]|nr:hypothetical protein [Thermoanaerobaculia bacterium]
MMHSRLLAFSLLLSAPAAFADREVSHPISASAPAASVRRVVVDIPAGEIVVRNGDALTIAINGVARREYERNREENQRIVNDISAEIYLSNDEAIIRRKFGPKAQGWKASKLTVFDVTVTVPRGMSIEMETKVGEVTIDGTFGDVDVDLRAGEIEVRMPRKSVRELSASCRIGEVHTDFGEQIVDREGIFPGRTQYFNSKGTSRVKVHTTVGEVNVTLTP